MAITLATTQGDQEELTAFQNAVQNMSLITETRILFDIIHGSSMNFFIRPITTTADNSSSFYEDVADQNLFPGADGLMSLNLNGIVNVRYFNPLTNNFDARFTLEDQLLHEAIHLIDREFYTGADLEKFSGVGTGEVDTVNSVNAFFRAPFGIPVRSDTITILEPGDLGYSLPNVSNIEPLPSTNPSPTLTDDAKVLFYTKHILPLLNNQQLRSEVGNVLDEAIQNLQTALYNVQNYTQYENSVGTTLSELQVGTDTQDVLIGDEGNDYLFGRDGDDTFVGGRGADILDGSQDATGRDTASFAGTVSQGVSVALDQNGNAQVVDGYGDIDTLIGIENIIGTVNSLSLIHI